MLPNSLRFYDEPYAEVDKKLIFVAMPFDPSFDQRYERLYKRPLEEEGYTVLRTDEIYGSRPIMAAIIGLVQRARVVIADVTGRNPNVLFEAGLAIGLGKDVLLTASTAGDVPADLRHLTYVIAGAENSEQSANEIVLGIRALTSGLPLPSVLTAAQRLLSGCHTLGVEDIRPITADALIKFALSSKRSVVAVGANGRRMLEADLHVVKDAAEYLRAREVKILLCRPTAATSAILDRFDGGGVGSAAAQLEIMIHRFKAIGIGPYLTDELLTWGGVFIDGEAALLQFYYPDQWSTMLLSLLDVPGGIFSAFYEKSLAMLNEASLA